MKILIIEDEQELLKSIKDYLGREGFICESASDYKSGLEKIELYEYDCAIVDITLPDGSGLNLIRSLKERSSQTGIIIISAKNSLDDKIKGLEIGSDDYLTKPFHLSELNARVKSIIRRKNFLGMKEIVLNEIKILPDAKEVFVNKDPVELTVKEYDLLLFFLANKDRVITKSSIAERLWGDNMENADSFDFIYTHIKNLRKKLLEKGCVDYIQTIYGMGYKFKTN